MVSVPADSPQFTSEDIATLTALIRKATVGPWGVRRTGTWPSVVGGDDMGVASLSPSRGRGPAAALDNARFIAAARNTLTALLDALASRDAELARARETEAALREQLDGYRNPLDEAQAAMAAVIARLRPGERYSRDDLVREMEVREDIRRENTRLRAALAERDADREDVRPLLESASNRLGIFARALASSVAPAGFTEATMVLGVKRDLDSYLSHHDPAAAVRSPEEDRTDG